MSVFTCIKSCEELTKQFETDEREIDFIKTELPTFNKMIGGGLRTSEFIVFCGMQGKGKTTFLLREVIEGMSQGKKMAYICFEEEPIIIQTRIGCYKSRHRFRSHLKKMYEDGVKNDITDEMKKIKGVKIVYFYDVYKEYCKLYDNNKSEFMKNNSGRDQASCLYFLIRDLVSDGYSFIFLDYLAKIRGNIDKNSNTNEFYGEISENLKILVDKMNICLITSMQLNRGVYGKLKEKKLDPSEIDNEYIQKSIDVGANATLGVSFFKDPSDENVRILNIFKNRLTGEEGVIRTRLSTDKDVPLFTRVEIPPQEIVDKKIAESAMKISNSLDCIEENKFLKLR